MKTLWKVISASGLLLGIVSSILGIVTYFKVEDIEIAKGWKLAISIKEPSNESSASEQALMVIGKCDFRTTAVEMENNPATNLDLEKNKVELVVIVRQISRTTVWAVQTKPIVRQDGGFDALTILGEKGYKYQIVVLAVRAGSIKAKELVQAPSCYAASDSVTIKRDI